MLQRLNNVYDLFWRVWIHVMRTFFDLFLSTWSFFALTLFSLGVVIFLSSLCHEASKFWRPLLHLSWLFASTCIIPGWVIFPIIPARPFPKFLNHVCIVISNHISSQILCLWRKTCSPFKDLSKKLGCNFGIVYLVCMSSSKEIWKHFSSCIQMQRKLFSFIFLNKPH